MIFRREPIHKKLAREGRLLDEALPAVRDPATRSVWGMTGIHGVPRPRRWDAVASVRAPGVAGDEVHFVAVADGDLIVDEAEPAEALRPLAEAVEQTLRPPYRAEAVRRGEDVWAVAARQVRVEELEAGGDALELVVAEGERFLTVDGARIFGSVPELERIGSSESDSYVVRARRLDARLWEVEVTPL